MLPIQRQPKSHPPKPNGKGKEEEEKEKKAHPRTHVPLPRPPLTHSPLDSLAAATSGARSRQPPAGIDGVQHTNVTPTLRSSLLSGEIQRASPSTAKRGRLSSLGLCSPALLRSPPSPSSAPSLHPSRSRGIPSIHGRQRQIRRPTSWSTDAPPPSSHGIATGSLADARVLPFAPLRRPGRIAAATGPRVCDGFSPRQPLLSGNKDRTFKVASRAEQSSLRPALHCTAAMKPPPLASLRWHTMPGDLYTKLYD